MGNILVTVSDRKTSIFSGSVLDHYEADIVSSQEYYPFGMQMPGRGFSNPKYRYGFNGQEKSDEIAGEGNHNTALFWEYDTRIGRRWNTDPHPNVGLSQYAVLGNSPMWQMDIAGDTPTVHQAAQMAEDSYLDYKDRGTIDGGWTRLESYPGVEFAKSTSDFQSALYSRTVNGKTEFTFATAGTVSMEDWVNNFTQPFGSSQQYDDALTQAHNLIRQLGAQELTFTGHSLGGGTASLNAMVTGKAAITFNAAGLSLFTTNKYHASSKNVAGIQAFVIPGEAVDYYQAKGGLTSVGKRIWVHSLFGKVNAFSAALIKQIPISVYERYKLHGMEAMLPALEHSGYNDPKAIPEAEQDAYDMQGSYMWERFPVGP